MLPAAALLQDNAFTINGNGGVGAPNAFGFRVQDIIANLRLDQAWGFVGISAALHDVSGAYYGSNTAVNDVNAFPANGVGNGHPADRYGWALAGGAKFNLTGGDMIGFNVCYAEGAPGYCTNNAVLHALQLQHQRGRGLDRRRRLQPPAPDIELTRVWSALGAYEHIWNPKWRTSVFGGYVNVDYGSDATARHPAAHCRGALAACGVAPDRARY